MTLIGLVVVLLIVGFALYLISLMPLDPTVKKIILAVVIFFLLLYVLGAVGLLPHGAIRLK